MKPCKVMDCQKPARSRGWCNGHYLRWWKTGDLMEDIPLVPKGETDIFVEDVIMRHQGEECLAWPFSCDGAGYGKKWQDGKLERVARIVCKRVNGPPPTPKHEAAHSCGKGHLACVSPHHLDWKTAVQNAADKIVHGTQFYGERSPVSKLKQPDVDRIFEMKALGIQQRAIATAVGISRAQVCRILKGQHWGQREQQRRKQAA